MGGRKKKAGEAVLGYFEVGKTGHKGIRLESEGPRQSAGSFKPFRGVLKAALGVKDDIFVHFRSFGAVLRPPDGGSGFFSSISGAMAVVVHISRRSKTLFFLL